MAKNGPILIIEDDPDDCELISDAIHDLKLENELLCFPNGSKALDYLQKTEEQPFLIFCDINMPIMGGLELRKAVFENEYLRRKSVPFIFLTTSAVPHAVREAYNLTVQGFFVKPNSYQELFELLKQVINYWRTCKHPNNLLDAAFQ